MSSPLAGGAASHCRQVPATATSKTGAVVWCIRDAVSALCPEERRVLRRLGCATGAAAGMAGVKADGGCRRRIGQRARGQQRAQRLKSTCGLGQKIAQLVLVLQFGVRGLALQALSIKDLGLQIDRKDLMLTRSVCSHYGCNSGCASPSRRCAGPPSFM